MHRLTVADIETDGACIASCRATLGDDSVKPCFIAPEQHEAYRSRVAFRVKQRKRSTDATRRAGDDNCAGCSHAASRKRKHGFGDDGRRAIGALRQKPHQYAAVLFLQYTTADPSRLSGEKRLHKLSGKSARCADRRATL